MARTWHRVARVTEVTGPPWPCRDVPGASVVLVRDDAGAIHAVDARCPHLQAPMTRAVVTAATIECPTHWYAFDLATGENRHPGWDDCRLGVHPVEVVGGDVRVAVEAR